MSAGYALYVCAVALLLGGIVVGAKSNPSYSHVRHTISELGEVGSRHCVAVSLGVFLPVAALLGILAWLLRTTTTATAAPAASLLALCIAVGYGSAAFFPCDPGSPISGSWRQTLHNLGGGVQYFGGALAVWSLAEHHGALLRLAAVGIGLGGIALSVQPWWRGRGLLQRVAETLLFLCLGFALWHAGAGSRTAVPAMW